MREMAKIVRVESISPIPNKDRIVVAKFKGMMYESIVGIETQVGDLMVWIEADSILPVEEKWEMLRARCYKEKLNGFLIKPMKMGGVKSWGLTVGLDKLPPKIQSKAVEGLDVTDVLGIIKFEPGVTETVKKRSKFITFLMKLPFFRKLLLRSTGIKRKSTFPSNLIPKSDEDNLQTRPNLFSDNKDVLSYVSAKMEGCSATYVIDNKNKYLICSRNQSFLERVPASKNYHEVSDTLDLKKILREYKTETGKSLALQGEICGPGIQKNIYKLDKPTLFLYTIRDTTNNRYFSLQELLDFCDKYNIAHVPILARDKPLKELFKNIESVISYAEGVIYRLAGKGAASSIITTDEKPTKKEKVWSDYFIHEGIVVRGIEQEFSFKVKNLNYAEHFYGNLS